MYLLTRTQMIQRQVVALVSTEKPWTIRCFCVSSGSLVLQYSIYWALHRVSISYQVMQQIPKDYALERSCPHRFTKAHSQHMHNRGSISLSVPYLPFVIAKLLRNNRESATSVLNATVFDAAKNSYRKKIHNGLLINTDSILNMDLLFSLFKLSCT